MEIPDPYPGLVIRYAYLWCDQQALGQDEGSKDRPCAIVLAVIPSGSERPQPRVVVAAITHAPPAGDSQAIPLPPATAKRLGLDDEPHWIITQEVNLFTWPGPDIRPVPNKLPASIAYGDLPHALTKQLIDAVRERARQRTARSVERVDP